MSNSKYQPRTPQQKAKDNLAARVTAALNNRVALAIRLQKAETVEAVDAITASMCGCGE